MPSDLQYENEYPARQRSFNTAGLLAKNRRHTNQNPIFVAMHILLIARTIWGRFWSDGRIIGKVLASTDV